MHQPPSVSSRSAHGARLLGGTTNGRVPVSVAVIGGSASSTEK
uniref:Uncharacterized protein n=1 Tax=Arundo donax TaxID=35708 RepID=A0A0A8YHH4_ARUDO